ncbi:MAG: hypothetical protein ALAOOOJD_03253 [bacterium]|nr:hypothetical protein [bacterium]
MGTGDYPTARRLFSTLLIGKDFYFNAYWRLAQCYAFDGRFDQGQTFFENLLGRGAPAGEVYSALAFLAEFRGDRKQTLDYCWQAVQQRTAFLSIHQKLIDLAPLYGLEQDVREHLTQRRAQDADDWLAEYALAYWETLRARPEISAAQFARLAAAGHSSWRIYFRWAIQFMLMSKLDSARVAIEQGLAATTATNDRDGAAQLFLLKGHVYLRAGHLNRADSLIKQAGKMSRENGYLDLQADIAGMLSGLRLRQGHLQEALAHAQNAQALSSKLHNAYGTMLAHHYKADVFRATGFYEQAIREWTLAYQMADSLKNESNRQLMVHNLAAVYQILGDHQRAQTYFREAIAYARKYQQSLYLISFLQSLAVSLVELQHLTEAKQYYDEALTIAEKNNLTELQSNLWLSLANWGKRVNNWPLAEKMATQALSTARRTQSQTGMVSALETLGEIALHHQQLAQADAYFQETKRLSAAAGFYGALIKSINGLGMVAMAAGHHQEAVVVLQEAATLVSHRIFSSTGGTASGFLPFEKELFFTLSRAYVRLQQPQQALQVAEQMRDLVVRRRLQQSGLLKYAAVADSLRQQGARLDAMLLKKRLQLVNIFPADSININAQKVRLEIAQLEWQQNRLWEKIGLTVPQSFDDHILLPVTTWQQELTERHELALTYLVGEDGVLIFVVAGDSLLAHELAIGKAALRNLIGQVNPAFYYALQDSQSLQLISPLFFRYNAETANQLYQMLLARFIGHARDKRLLIIPDEDLHFLPFEILLTATVTDTVAKDYRRFQYLLRNYSVRYASSLAAAMNHSPQQRQMPATVLALAQATPRLKENGNGARDLWQTKSEAAAIQEILGTAAVQIADGPFSGDWQWRNDLSQHPILHFAAHSEAQNAEPLSSRIILEEDETGAASLYAFEISAMHLPAGRLAFLSSCNTASGILRGSEGIQGFVQAFRAAGVPSVIGSLWPTEPATSTKLTTQFYANLRAGQSAATALCAAKLTLLANDRANPFFWAAFQYYGVDQTFRFRQNLNWMPFGIVILLAFMIGFTRRLREQKANRR